mmetsp:Transcript_129858/g.277219  ORF Transcript_129858/g.277219 Transcript_129858/m.277219 type:complete len:96 (+) Transcript_129858:1883-2170(+)
MAIIWSFMAVLPMGSVAKCGGKPKLLRGQIAAPRPTPSLATSLWATSSAGASGAGDIVPDPSDSTEEQRDKSVLDFLERGDDEGDSCNHTESNMT